MKKTLVALSIAAFAASASAVTVYDNEGTKVQVDGSLRLLAVKESAKTKEVDGSKSTTDKHSNLKNAGSRFGVRVNHNISDDFYALGRLELRFDGKNASGSTSDAFGDVYAKRAYVGLGSKQYGEVTFGRQVTIADDVGNAGFDYSFGLIPDVMTASGNSVVRYDYKGIEGLQVGVNYNFATERDANSEITVGRVKNGYGAGAIYEFAVAEGQTVNLHAGYTRDNYVTGTNKRHYKDAWEVSGAYTFNDLTVALDGGQAYEKDQGVKTRTSFVAPGVKFQVTDKSSVYGHYVFQHVKTGSDKEKSHGVMLGSDYQLHKQVVTYVEGALNRTRASSNGVKGSTTTDRQIGVGLRVYW